MAEILSQEEINKLLNSVTNGEVDIPDQKDQIKIKIYDFNRPDVFSESLLTGLSLLHEQLAQSLTNSLTELFQLRASFHVSSVCALTYEEFLRSIPNPCFLSTISMSPFPYSSAIEIDPQLIDVIIDLLTGGDSSNASIKNIRDFSELDTMILKDFFPMIARPFREMWNTKIPINPVTESIESNPMKVKISYLQAMIILVTIETAIGQGEGMVNICYPVNFIRIPFMTDLSKNDKQINPKQEKVNNMRCKIHNQYRIGNFTLKAVKNFKKKQEIIIRKDTLCSHIFTPVIHNEEV